MASLHIDKDLENLIKKIALDSMHPIGSLYITTTNDNPGNFMGGTWVQIKDDAYFKIVSSKPGILGGTSKSHKIPLSSMPSHNHVVKFDQSANGGTTWLKTGGNSGGPFYSAGYVENAGGGQAYYPYYYGIYVWKRTA